MRTLVGAVSGREAVPTGSEREVSGCEAVSTGSDAAMEPDSHRTRAGKLTQWAPMD
jgi:hypothetical protein